VLELGQLKHWSLNLIVLIIHKAIKVPKFEWVRVYTYVGTYVDTSIHQELCCTCRGLKWLGSPPPVRSVSVSSLSFSASTSPQLNSVPSNHLSHGSASPLSPSLPRAVAIYLPIYTPPPTLPLLLHNLLRARACNSHRLPPSIRLRLPVRSPAQSRAASYLFAGRPSSSVSRPGLRSRTCQVRCVTGLCCSSS
jgi:hypothetical protein